MKKMDMEQHVNRLLAFHPVEIKEWIAFADGLLRDNGCKIDAKLGDADASILLTYASRRSQKRVCRISIGEEGCKAFPYGHNFACNNTILPSLPETMLDAMSDGKHECTGCATKRPDLITHSFRYMHKGRSYNRCRHHGFGFSLEDAEKRVWLSKWLAMEVACV